MNHLLLCVEGNSGVYTRTRGKGADGGSLMTQSTTALRSYETAPGTSLPPHVKVPGTSQVSGPTQPNPGFDPEPGKKLATQFANRRPR